MRSVGCIALIALLAFPVSGAAFVRLHVERITVQVNTPFTITIEAAGKKVEDPKIPDIEGLDIEKVPSSSASKTQVSLNLSQSNVIQVRELGYVARAKRVGKILIPRIPIRIDGVDVFSEPLQLTAVNTPVPATPAMPPPVLRQVAAPGGESPSVEKAELTPERLAFITSDVDKTEAFQGEPVLLRLQLWRLLADGVSVGARREAEFRYPDTEGFYAAAFEPRVTRSEREGWPYEVMEYRQLLFPTTAGELKIGSWHWEGSARALTRQGTRRWDYDLDTDPISLTVKPLPPPPADFSGTVGHFDFTAQLGRNEVLQGAPVKLDLVLTGQGNPNAIGEPGMPQMEQVYISDPEKNTEALGDGISVRKTVTYAITPLQPGDVTIPALTFCFFDPETQRYETITHGPFALHVLPSTEPGRRVWVGEPVANENGGVEVIGEDIRAILTEAPPLHPRHTSVPANVTLFAAPVCAYAGLAFLMRRKRRFDRDVGFSRNHHAKARGRKRLRDAVSAADPSEALYRAVVGFIADKFNAPEAGLTSADIHDLFRERGIAEDVETTFAKILRACERARYGSTALSGDEIQALVHAASHAMDALEHAAKGVGA